MTNIQIAALIIIFVLTGLGIEQAYRHSENRKQAEEIRLDKHPAFIENRYVKPAELWNSTNFPEANVSPGPCWAAKDLAWKEREFTPEERDQLRVYTRTCLYGVEQVLDIVKKWRDETK